MNFLSVFGGLSILSYFIDNIVLLSRRFPIEIKIDYYMLSYLIWDSISIGNQPQSVLQNTVSATTLPQVLEDPCMMNKEYGTCRGFLKRFYFDKNSGKCQSFFYGGNYLLRIFSHCFYHSIEAKNGFKNVAAIQCGCGYIPEITI